MSDAEFLAYLRRIERRAMEGVVSEIGDNMTKSRIKVQGGTPRSDLKSLCLTCHSGGIIKGQNLEYMIHCWAFERPVTFPVAECSSYTDKRQPSLHDMKTVAWNVETRGKRGPAGFSEGVKTEGEEIREVEITPPKPRKDYGYDD